MTATQPAWSYRFASDYLRLACRAFAHTAAGGTVRLHWNGPAYDAASWRREFGRALDRRINLKGGNEPKGRRLTERYQTDLLRDRHILDDMTQRHIRHYQFNTPEMQQRFGHLLASRED